jgi:hypothetical protein
VLPPLGIFHQRVRFNTTHGEAIHSHIFVRFSDGRTATDDYSAFNDVWDKPDGGMHKYLFRFLTSPDATFQHIAVWTIVQLLESGGTISYHCVPEATQF